MSVDNFARTLAAKAMSYWRAAPQGPQGDKGDKGDTGDTGPVGPAGSSTAISGADKTANYVALLADKGLTIRVNATSGAKTITVSAAFGSTDDLYKLIIERSKNDATSNPIIAVDGSGNLLGQILAANNGYKRPKITIWADGTDAYGEEPAV